MATLTITVAAGGEAGATFRKLGAVLQNMASAMPDRNPTGASTVLTIDNAPATGTCSVQITAGPYAGSLFTV